ncbi:hypothetical protein GCM10028808_22830 [Spirosoma migulaei]
MASIDSLDSIDLDYQCNRVKGSQFLCALSPVISSIGQKESKKKLKTEGIFFTPANCLNIGVDK